MSNRESIIHRPVIQEDLNFVYATFLRGLYYGNEYYSAVDKRVFMDNYKKIIDYRINNQPGIDITVAVLKSDPTVIVGYVMTDTARHSVVWVFVKKAWRNMGAARGLVDNSYKEYNEVTKVGLIIATKKGMQFNPFVS